MRPKSAYIQDKDVKAPKVRFDPTYNPFKSSTRPSPANWDILYNEFEKETGNKEYERPEISAEDENRVNDVASAAQTEAELLRSSRKLRFLFLKYSALRILYYADCRKIHCGD